MLRRLFFEYWYFFKPPWDTGISPPELLTWIAQSPPGSALDLGCGTGTNAITLAQHHWQVTAIDYASKAIGMARRKAHSSGVQVRFEVGDVTRLDWLNSSFDLILDIGCFHNLEAAGKTAYRQNLQRLLAPGGTFLLYTFIRDEGDTKSRGLVSADLDDLNRQLTLVERKDGSDRGLRHSAWLRYERREAQTQGWNE